VSTEIKSTWGDGSLVFPPTSRDVKIDPELDPAPIRRPHGPEQRTLVVNPNVARTLETT
jgi:hypothetical protein